MLALRHLRKLVLDERGKEEKDRDQSLASVAVEEINVDQPRGNRSDLQALAMEKWGDNVVRFRTFIDSHPDRKVNMANPDDMNDLYREVLMQEIPSVH